MKEQLKPEIVCIIDRSGSMEAIRDDAIGSFNAFLEEQKRIGSDALVTIVLFDDQYDVLHNGSQISKVNPFTTETYIPRGTTALYDAIGRTIAAIDARYDGKKEKTHKKDNVTIAILTDGHENASREFNRDQIFKLIKERTKKKGWDFIYLSANKSAFDDGCNIGIIKGNILQFAKDAKGTKRAYSSMSNAIQMKRTTGKLGDWKKD